MRDVFRKKTLDRVNSPEDLNEYMRVANPPIWIALVAVIMILLGSIVWGYTTTLETTAKALAVSTDDGISCYISESNITDVEIGSVVRFEDEEYTVSEIDSNKLKADDVLNDYEMHLADFKEGEEVYCASLEGEAEHGSYQAEVILDEISPVSLLLSSSN